MVPRDVRRWVWLAIIIAVGAGAYVMVGDVRNLGGRLGNFAWPAFALALALALLNYAIRFVRWELYLRHQRVRVPLSSSALVFGSGLSLSVTPGKVGELVKSFLLRELHGVPVSATAPVVVAERVTDLIALVIVAVIGVAAYGVETAVVLGASVLLAIGLVLLAWPAPARSLIDLLTAPRRLRRFRMQMHDLYGELVTLCRPKMLITATAIAIPAWAAECIGFAAIVNAFPDASVDLGLAMVIYAATTMAGALSFLPGGLGVTEGAMAILLVQSAAALDRGSALDATMLTRIATLWFAVVLGLGLLAITRRRIAAIAARTKPPDAAPSA